MRFIILIGLFGFSASLFAKQNSFDFKCETNPKTTTFTLTADGDDMVLTTQHVNGVDFMPVHEGVIVPNDLPYLTSASTTLKHMGAQNQFRFPKARCKIFGPGLLSCSGGETKTFDGLEMQALSLVTKKVTTRVYDLQVDSMKVTLDVNISGFVPVQEVTMEYDPNDCKFSF